MLPEGCLQNMSLNSVTLKVLTEEREFSLSEFIRLPFIAFLAKRELHAVRGESCSVKSDMNGVLRSEQNYFYFYNYYFYICVSSVEYNLP